MSLTSCVACSLQKAAGACVSYLVLPVVCKKPQGAYVSYLVCCQLFKKAAGGLHLLPVN